MLDKFDKAKMDYLLAVKNKSYDGWAKHLGISRVTLYRKINGESDFWRNEMSATCDYLEENNLYEIFFAEQVA